MVHAGERCKGKGRKSITVVCGFASHSWLWNSSLWLLITHWLSSTANPTERWGDGKQRCGVWKEDRKRRRRKEQTVKPHTIPNAPCGSLNGMTAELRSLGTPPRGAREVLQKVPPKRRQPLVSVSWVDATKALFPPKTEGQRDPCFSPNAITTLKWPQRIPEQLLL